LAACADGQANPAAPASVSASATPSPDADLNQPGQAAAAIEALIAAAGSAHAIKAELDATTASLSVVIGQDAVTWQWRDGTATRVESDTAYVGQAIFDPRDFNLRSLGDLFRRAAQVAGASQRQRLHIVEYADGHVYMTVTTNPESAPVFFLPDGSLVKTLDFQSASGIAQGLAEAAAGRSHIIAAGLDAASGGAYVEARGVWGQIVRSLRMSQLPPRDTVRSEFTALGEFNPHVIDAAAISRVLARLPSLTGHADGAVALAIDRRDGADEPAMYFSAGGRELKTTLSGVVLSG
jgi:hypothetical protein